MAAFRPAEVWRKFKTRLFKALVQDCPPEMAACEICLKVQCGDDAWLTCANRLEAERQLRRGDYEALDALRRAHRGCGCTPAEAVSGRVDRPRH